MNYPTLSPRFTLFLILLVLLSAGFFSQLNAQLVSETTLWPAGYEEALGFGSAVAIDNNTIFAGAPNEAGEGHDFPGEGAVFVFERQGFNWIETDMLKPGGAGLTNQLFGSALALDNDWAIIGASAYYGDGEGGHGKAYFFYNDGESWNETQMVSFDSDSLAFGSAVDIDNQWAVIGAPSDTGSVYVYHNQGLQWNLHTRLLPADSADFNTNFGRDVAVSGQHIIVGTLGQGAYIYHYDGASWMQQKRITTTESNAAISGRSVDILGSRASVAALPVGDGYYAAVTYTYDAGDWIEEFLTENIYIDNFNSFDIRLNDNTLYVGNPADAGGGNDFPYQGSILAFNNAAGNWSGSYEIIPGSINNEHQASQYFGSSVAVENAVVVGGAPWRDDGMGIVYVHELAPSPETVNASSGAYADRVRISWDKDTVVPVTGFNIYREEELISSTRASAVAYSDYQATAGKLHTYNVSGVTEWGASTPRSALGWQPVNGELEGSVNTLYGAGVDSVEMQIISDDIELNSCLQFAESNQYVIMEGYNRFPTDDITVSFWIKTSDTRGSFMFSYAAPGTDYNTFLVGVPGDINIYMDPQGAAGENFSTGVTVNDGLWHHLAITWQSTDGELNIIKDGIVVFTGQIIETNSLPDSGAIVLGQDQDAMGGGFQASQAFHGILDEVQIWNMVRSPQEIREDMYKKLTGDEFNLVSYWSFDDQPNRTPQGITGDYARESGQHGLVFGAGYSSESSPAANKVITDGNGNYSLENIYYGESAQFDLIPAKGAHAFDPEQRTIEINSLDYQLRSINFIDTTILTVRGNIKYAGTDCNVAGVQILLDNVSEGIVTNSAGIFSFSIERPGVYNIRPVLADSTSSHGFIPEHMNIIVEEDVLDLAFMDTTRQRLSGKFGASCANTIGSAQITISSINHNNNLFRDTIQTDAQGFYDVLLPAQPYKADILSVDLSDINLVEDFVLQYFGQDTVDLSWLDQQHDFTYRNPPVIRINGWPRFGSGAFNVPILEQGDYYDLLIEVLDVWAGDSCHVNQGSITIMDVISGRDETPLTLQLQNGQALYRCVPDEPLILSGGDHPFQKMIQIVASVGEETIDHIQWALITGSNPRTQTFTATTPEIPFLILRDPPGDQSYSYFSKDESVSWTAVHSFQTGSEFSVWYDVRLGAITGTSVGTPFFSTEFEFGGYAILAGEMAIGTEQQLQAGTYNSFTFNQEFSTSDDDAVVGAEGDVYLGASYVNLYALTDVLDYDWNAQDVILDTLLAWEPESVESFFSYTESHIRHTLLPQLQLLRQVESSGANRQSLITKYDNSINVWNTILLKNDTLKNEAVYNDNFAYRNISFSAGAPYSASFTSESSASYSYDFSIYLDTETAIGAGAVLFGVPAEGGIRIKTSLAYQRVNEYNTTQTITTGFTLADDDPGDYFSTNIKTDPAYGTPVFELFGGTSSNPWEDGTQARDGVNIALNSFVRYDIPPDEAAPFILYLGNTSESDEQREYHLKVMQSSNLDGAIIRVGGVVIEDHLSYVIPAGEQLNATLTVERGPIAYDYENMKIKFYAPGDEDVIYDIANFSVHYISPCSDVNLLYPLNNWLVNSSHNDTLQVVINNYDLDNPFFERIKFQYRRIGDGWSTAFSYEKEDIAERYIVEYWRLDDLLDGTYELRAVSDCGTQGVKYSAIASGVIDRRAVFVFGTPEPADAMLNIGEDISVSFSAQLDPAYLSNSNISLFTMDDSTIIAATAVHFGNKIIITPTESLDSFDDRILIARVSGVRDINGNFLREAVSWSFRVNRNPVFWNVSNIEHSSYQGHTDSFVRTLSNVGIAEDSFTLSHYPQWLIPDVTNGSIAAGGERPITFVMDTELNVGSYRDSVIALTTIGEEKLLVSLNILNEPPDWSVTAANYSYSMNIIGIPTFENEVSDDKYDIISVFAGNEVRGFAHVEYLPAIEKYVAFITVYSDQVSGESLSFRMWDASEGKEYALLDSDYIFENNTILGSVSNPLVLEAEASVQVIEMNAGWTWFSLNVTNQNNHIRDIFAQVEASNGDVIKGQRTFCLYDSSIGWYGPLQQLQAGHSYQVFLRNGATINYTGVPVSQTQATLLLNSGWNWMGHLNQNILDLNETLANLPSVAGDRIKSQTQFADYVQATQTWEGSLKKLLPGMGYLIKTSTPSTLQYPVLSKTAFSFPAIAQWDVDINSYEYNMGIAFVVEFDDSEVSDSSVVVAAFSDYVCRGVSQLVYVQELQRYYGFLHVYSNNELGDSINFQIYFPQQDKIRTVNEKVLFSAADMLGTLSQPYALLAEALGDELVPGQFYLSQNYPNPFNPKTTIEYGLPKEAKVSLRIFNSLGQNVATLVNKRQDGNRYSIIFNPENYAMASGIYFYYIQAGNYQKVRKMLYIK